MDWHPLDPRQAVRDLVKVDDPQALIGAEGQVRHSSSLLESSPNRQLYLLSKKFTSRLRLERMYTTYGVHQEAVAK